MTDGTMIHGVVATLSIVDIIAIVVVLLLFGGLLVSAGLFRLAGCVARWWRT